MIKVKSISEVLEFLEGLKNESLVFRGENKKYPSITSSAFRKKSDMKIDMGRGDNLNSMLRSYYREIGHTLNLDEKNNFLCFAQHHGLPTNLIDLTETISTALYFASTGNKEDYGYVYIFKTKNKIKLSTEILGGNQIIHIFDTFNYDFVSNDHSLEFSNLHKYRNLTFEIYKEIKRIIIENRFEVIDSYVECFQIIMNSRYQEEVTKNNIDNILRTLNLSNDSFNIGSKILKMLKNMVDDPFCIEFIKTYDMNKEKLKLTYANDVLTCDTLVLWTLYEICYFMFWGNHTDEHIHLPHVLYYPDVIFERIGRQNGLFIYQNYPKNSVRSDSVETIKYDFVIEIQNKKKIQDELKKLGISRKTLFPDYDNIANDIKQKFGFL